MAPADELVAWPLSSPVLPDLAEFDPGDGVPVMLDLVGRFAQIDEPRRALWVEHPLPVVLALCAGAVVAGNCSFTAIAGWVAEVPAQLLSMLCRRCGREPGQQLTAPSKSTIWRVATSIDAGQADAAIGAWLLGRAEQSSTSEGKPTPGNGHSH